MDYKIIRKEELTASVWSGGTTTQLAIWPEDAAYADRSFTWRVSTARIEVEESEFTPLPGVRRVLMVLDGTLELMHEGHGAVRLERFGQAGFDGGWTTRSHGRVADFNLMTTDGEGCVEKLDISQGSSLPFGPQSIPPVWSICSEVFYIISSDQLAIMPDGRAVPLHAGDVILRQYGRDGCETMEIFDFSRNGAHIIRANVFHN